MAQGTVRDFDPETRTGTLLMDDRSEVAIEASSIPAGSEIRYLRIGQRVGFELDDATAATATSSASSAPSEAPRRVARELRVVTFGT